jgi:HTH-type transcriptional regulator/antitoxin HigA
MQMTWKPVKNDRELTRALKRIDDLGEAEPGTSKGDELDALMRLVEKYEDQNYAVPASDPIETIKFLMEKNSLSRKNPEPCIGASGRVSEV